MPNYDYECTSCDKVMEIFQQMSDAPLQKCPECGEKVKRLVGGGLGVIFKGSGFYATDSKKGSSTQSGKSKSNSSPEAATSAKSDVSESCGKCPASAACSASDK